MNRPGLWWGLAALILSLVLAPIAGRAQPPAPLPPAAQDAFDKGITAAKEGGYVLAIRYLQEARKLVPQAPQIFRSLGAVEARVPGRELRAIAWYGAYLAALPTAPDAAEVSKEIARLEVKSEISISGLIKSVQDAASQVHSGGGYSNPLPGVAVLWAKAGDIATALKTANSLDDEFDKSIALSATASAQAEAGDTAGAQKTGDLAAIRPLHKAGAQEAIGKAQIRAGDIAGAQKTFVAALKSAERSGDETVMSVTATNVAVAQSEIGDIAGAQKNASLIQSAYFKQNAQLAIANAQIKAGDIAGAQSTLASAQKIVDHLEEGVGKRLAKLAIAEAKAAIADAPNAPPQSTADPQTPSQPATQPVATASDWLSKLDDEYNDCPLNSAPFLDLAGYLKSLPPSDDLRTVFEGLRGTAAKIVAAKNVIDQMLRRQAER